jgi:C4-dicarboxylate transporter DctM subunit
MIVYAMTTGAAVGDMFASGAVVGIMIVAFLLFLVFFYARKEKWPKNTEKISFKRFIENTIKAIPALCLPLIILGGIYSGIFTATESAAVATIWALISGMFIYRELKPKDILPIVIESAKSSATILVIVATSTAFAWLFTYSGLSKGLINAVVSIGLPTSLFLLIFAAIILIFGTFLEGIAICLLLVPVFWPIAHAMNVNVIHFGMIFSIGIVIGCMTPPVAVNIFAASTITKQKMGDIAKGEIPFMLAYIIVMLIVIFIPQISTFLIA